MIYNSLLSCYAKICSACCFPRRHPCCCASTSKVFHYVSCLTNGPGCTPPNLTTHHRHHSLCCRGIGFIEQSLLDASRVTKGNYASVPEIVAQPHGDEESCARPSLVRSVDLNARCTERSAEGKLVEGPKNIQIPGKGILFLAATTH